MKPFEKIYKVVSSIPKGKVLTYQQVAKLARVNPPAGGPRIVGFAMHSNKNTKVVPCHRVVGSRGELTGYARGGVTKKKEILEKEGVFFLDNDRVDLKRSLF
ncbi:MAG: MGMT family protein [Candidatus Levybacteria bacterium]|nr:MGMT family protein [Candidatus Levybacteria bacterium]MBI3093060.1 MGMT family protein [Candidatus Levybacteria bacterium]